MKKSIYKHWLFWRITDLIVTVGLNIIVLTPKTQSVSTNNTSNIPQNVYQPRLNIVRMLIS